jgi:hypothetical protein
MDTMLCDQVFHFEQWGTHSNSKSLCFIGTSDYTSIIIRKDYNGLSNQVWPEQPFAGSVKVITVNKSENSLYRGRH